MKPLIGKLLLLNRWRIGGDVCGHKCDSGSDSSGEVEYNDSGTATDEEEEQFAEKAIDSLYKKLKSKHGAIEQLHNVINHPHMPSACITIARSLDGRLQVSHRKGLPHVIYCRLFRWSDLRSQHELRALPHCLYSFASKQSQVCINPYHYERVAIGIDMTPPPPTQQLPQPQMQMQMQHNPNYYYNENCATMASNSAHGMSWQSGPIAAASWFSSSCSYSSSSSESSPPPPTDTSWSIDSASATYVDEQQSSAYAYASSCHNSAAHYPLPSQPAAQVNTCAPAFNWCSLAYFELSTRLGEMFHTSARDIYVDGRCSPSLAATAAHLPLGSVSNATRTECTGLCRRHIGRGVRIYVDEASGGDVYVECLSSSAVFVQAPVCNYVRGAPLDTVHKLTAGYTLRIFQASAFVALLDEAAAFGYDRLYELTKMCAVKLSFVKGWSGHYTRREILTCPCWLEIKLNAPFHWLDQALRHAGASANPVTSYS